MKSVKKLRLASLLAMVIGLAIGLTNYLWFQGGLVKAGIVPTHQTAFVSRPPKAEAVYGRPKRLIISSLNINLPIIEGSYNAKTKQWTLTLDKAQYATSTALPNNLEGNTFIYGHYRPKVFATLRLIKSGAAAQIVTDNNLQFNYTYKYRDTVAPTDTRVFGYQGAPRLTIQTCSGAFMQNRQLYYFDYSDYQKV